jgi:putative Ca2+/H+ antiporter (TMEM165/GDT1 family)
LKLLKDGYEMEGGHVSEELQEVEEELEHKKAEGVEHDDVVDMESGTKKQESTPAAQFAAENLKVFTQVGTVWYGAVRYGYSVVWPAQLLLFLLFLFWFFSLTSFLLLLSQAFTLTFLAEWGDRSQIATIALASSKNVFGVILGGLIGHAFCTGLAVVGGRMLAAKISEKTTTLVGGTLFIFFAVTSLLWGPDME